MPEIHATLVKIFLAERAGARENSGYRHDGRSKYLLVSHFKFSKISFFSLSLSPHLRTALLLYRRRLRGGYQMSLVVVAQTILEPAVLELATL
jgi:hypothetical protein